MKYPKRKKKYKFERTCYNCKYHLNCTAARYSKYVVKYCEKFKFCSSCKSM